MYTSFLQWLPVFGLSLSAFIFNTTEFVPISLLSDIASEFSMSEAQVGHLMTIYAWIVATISLPLMLLTKDVERKTLLISIFIIFIVSHVLSYVAWSYDVLLISRVGIAVAHAIFWSITVSLTYRLAPKNKHKKAIGFLASGTSLAVVLGLPLGRIIGQWSNWRVTFGCIGIVAFLLMLLLIKILPKLPSHNAGNLKSLPQLMKRPALVGTYLLTILIITAHFCAYSYIEPFIQQIAHGEANLATWVLFVFGIAGILGSILFSKLSHKKAFSLFILPIVVMVLSQVLLLPLAPFHTPFLILCLFWGITICLISMNFQVVILELASDATDVGMSLLSSLYNVGIGGGALVGGLIITHVGLSSVGFFAALIGVVAFGTTLYTYQRFVKKS